ncbi:MAG TPA: ATP-binding domain-containing protein, partial [Holophaga sp.]|nr:ATP-binding domain-containing protein [Holophaga sp.]
MLALPFFTGKDDGFGPELPPCRVLTAEKLKSPYQALRNAVGGGNWEAFSTSRHAVLHRLAPERRDAILAALTPKLLPPPSLAELLAEEAAAQDRAGERLLDHLAGNFVRGRYRVQGAPGSGKSWLGRKVARVWAAEGRRVLVVAFNRALTYATQCALDDATRTGAVLVSTFHDLAANLLDELGELPACPDEPAAKQAFFDHALPEAFAAALPRIARRWDALVVDEAQDLDPAWVASLQGLLARPDEDPVLLLEDPAQSLYRKVSHTLGQPWRLDLSLRQGSRLRNAAVRAFPACGWPLVADIEDTPPDAFHTSPSSPRRWRDDLADLLGALKAEGLDPGQVLVLAPHRPVRLGLCDGQTMGPWPLNLEADWWEGEKAGHVRVGTVHAFKGLEADVVVFLSPAYSHADAERLRYTALSRARHRV